MKIHVLSKKNFDELLIKKGIHNGNIHEYSGTAFISINDNNSKETTLNDNHNVKVMFFDDVTEDIISDGKIKAKAITESQANELYEFIQKHKDKKVIIVHCAAGISRSGAVGVFLNYFTNGRYADFKKINPQVHPNPLVLRLLKRRHDKNH